MIVSELPVIAADPGPIAAVTAAGPCPYHRELVARPPVPAGIVATAAGEVSGRLVRMIDGPAVGRRRIPDLTGSAFGAEVSS